MDRMKSEEVLMVFVKNPVEGQVKTRLAKTVGDQKALEIYHHLLDYTLNVVAAIKVDKIVCYSDFIPANDMWCKAGFKQWLQVGSDLGERMNGVFEFVFKEGYKKAVLIGSDCAELDEDTVKEAFALLAERAMVIGPATDGGYYLIGLKKSQTQLFLNKPWSTDRVLHETLSSAKRLHLEYALLQPLSDVDVEADLIKAKHIFPECN
jgi:uncharacterized protein